MKPPLVGAIAGVVALLTAGCANGQHANGQHSGGQHSGRQQETGASSPSPQQAVLLAARHAGIARSVTATFSMRTSGLIGVSMSGSVAEQVRPRLLADIDIASMRVAGQSLPGGMTEIVTDKALLMKASVLGPVRGGKPWIELRFSDLSGQTGIDLGKILQQAENNDPLAQTRLLAGAAGVRKIGTGTINGVPVTAYTGHYTMADAIAKLPADQRQAVQQQMARAGISTVDFTVWLDDQQQVRKIELREHGTALTLAMTMTVTSINQPVSVQLPPASQVKVVTAAGLGTGS
jgi:hypothetical protein